MKTKELNDKEKENIIKQKRSENKIISLLGFAAKAGRACFGTDKICDEIRRHGSNDDYSRFISGIVIMSSDISGNAQKRLVNCCRNYHAKCIKTDYTSETLGQKLGRSSDAVAVAVFDNTFKTALLKEMDMIIH
jgi:ribosomal protein L7Ae-like RNA K-turn-binding protein